MKKKTTLLILLMLALTGQIMAQDIQITRFERNYTSLIGSVSPVYDNTGEACAVIRFFMRTTDFLIEPNLGVLKREKLPGEIRLYVPQGTKRITVRHEGMMPLNGYVIPVQIESKATYDAELIITDEKMKNHKANKGHNVYVGAGYNIMSISGPAVALGFDISHHNIELGAVYGLNKTDDMYFYDSNSNVIAAYNYQAIRVQLRYGYDLKITDDFSIMPQIGGAYNLYIGSEVVKGKSDYQNANSMSLLAAVRVVTSFNDNFKLHITPEYDFGVYKDNNCKLLSDYDSTFKSWAEGFNLNIGLIYFF